MPFNINTQAPKLHAQGESLSDSGTELDLVKLLKIPHVLWMIMGIHLIQLSPSKTLPSGPRQPLRFLQNQKERPVPSQSDWLLRLGTLSDPVYPSCSAQAPAGYTEREKVQRKMFMVVSWLLHGIPECKVWDEPRDRQNSCSSSPSRSAPRQ